MTAVYALYCGKGKHYHVDKLVAHGDAKLRSSSSSPSVKGLSSKVIKCLSTSSETKTQGLQEYSTKDPSEQKMQLSVLTHKGLNATFRKYRVLGGITSLLPRRCN